MKKYTLFLLSVFTVFVFCGCHKHQQPQPPKEMNPKQFQADLEKYVVEECDFTESEAKAFVPLFREMRAKMFRCLETERKSMENRPESDEDFVRALSMLDSLGVEKAMIEMQYHKLMLKSIPARKVMESVRAEDEFLRETIHQMRGDKHQPEGPKAPDNGPKGPAPKGPDGPHVGPQPPHDGGPHQPAPPQH